MEELMKAIEGLIPEVGCVVIPLERWMAEYDEKKGDDVVTEKRKFWLGIRKDHRGNIKCWSHEAVLGRAST